ncbi:acyltransferase [uncultured Sphingomonas sp.]|uniref:acyltransferase family protein n=1 Tax=uncultured Sphingomonas sp. TaxID=158754 RepID=UPI0025F2F039|nr:acyltransferase [uncultured Sphingomonas sp.]
MTSLGERFAARATTGFDYARLVLALAVVLWHTFPVTMSTEALLPHVHEPIMVLVRVILPMFFALSGFLVSSSLERAPNLGVFLWHRVLRIFPALTVEVLLSALILGPLLTTVSLATYFTHREFFQYMVNIIGWIHFRLPGVFLDNPVSGIVNSSLWTVPSELECYITISVLFLIGFTKRPKLLAATYILAVALLTWRQMATGAPLWFNVDKFNLTLSFVAGMVVYRYRHALPGGFAVAFAAFAVACLLLYFPNAQYVASFPAAYAIAAFGCNRMWRPKLLFGGDYSYGLYLYAYPIQQTVVHLIGPGKFFETLGLSLLAMVCFAVFSWHVIEKRILVFKDAFPAIARWARRPSLTRRTIPV